MRLEWGQYLRVEAAERIVVSVTRYADDSVTLTAVASGTRGDPKWVVSNGRAFSSGAAVLGRTKSSGLPAMAVHVDRISPDVESVVVVAEPTDDGVRSLGALASAVHWGATVLPLPTITAPNSVAVELVEFRRHDDGWRLLAVGGDYEPGVGELPARGRRSIATAGSGPLAQGDAAPPSARVDKAIRSRAVRSSSSPSLVRRLSLLLVIALICGAAWVVIPKYRARQSVGTTAQPSLLGTPTPAGSVEIKNLDGSVLSDEVKVSALPPASNPPTDMAAVGPVYDVTPSRSLGPVVVSFPVPPGIDASDVVIGRQAGKGWEILGGLPTEDGRVATTVDHFSLITTFLSKAWAEIVGIAREVKRVLGLGAVGEPPVCDRSNSEAKATVTPRYIGDQASGKNFRVDVCSERSGGRARLKIVNRRPVAVRIKAPQATLADRTLPGVGDLAAIAMTALAKPLGGSEGALIPAGGQIVLEFADAAQKFPMSIDNAGIAWSVLFAVAGALKDGGGWKALGEGAENGDYAIGGLNLVTGHGWEDSARQGLAKLFKRLAKGQEGPLLLVAGIVSTIILAIRGTFDTILSLAGNTFADLDYTPAPPPIPTTTQAVATTLSCPGIVFEAKSENGAYGITATQVSCAEAEVIVRLVNRTHSWSSGPRSFVVGEFKCTVVTKGQYLEHGEYTCTNGGKQVTWNQG